MNEDLQYNNVQRALSFTTPALIFAMLDTFVYISLHLSVVGKMFALICQCVINPNGLQARTTLCK